MRATSYSPAGTAGIDLVNVKVLVENLIGEENKGFKILMRSTFTRALITNPKNL
jgi:alkylation response protein AidB-like acyl-CoA dehydrogenase